MTDNAIRPCRIRGFFRSLLPAIRAARLSPTQALWSI